MDPIKHVVLVMLENASCDRFFGCLSGSTYPNFEGVDATKKAYSNLDAKGKAFEQLPSALRQMQLDPNHELDHVAKQLAGGNSGFVKDLEEYHPDAAPAVLEESKANLMAYFPFGQLPAHHALAENFRVCDAWHCSVPGPTWPNRFFALSGSSNGFVRMPSGGKGFWEKLANAKMAYTQFQDTILTRIAAKKDLRFKVYYHDFPCSLILLRHLATNIRKNYDGFEKFLEDVRGKAEDFPDFVFIEPRYYGAEQNDDHPPHNVMKGQKLVAQIYNSLRKNEALWSSTLLVILHDEHGGFYDHVLPPTGAAPPMENCTWAEDSFTRYGVRVPALLVSPYVEKGVEKNRFDHTSLLKYLVEKWKLEGLGQRVQNATSIEVALRTDQPPRTDCVPSIPEPSDAQLASEHPELENDVQSTSPHHYGMDLFKTILYHGLEGAAVAEFLSSRYQIRDLNDFKKFFRAFKWQILRAVVVAYVRDAFAFSSASKSDLAKRRAQVIEDLIADAKAQKG